MNYSRLLFLGIGAISILMLVEFSNVKNKELDNLMIFLNLYKDDVNNVEEVWYRFKVFKNKLIEVDHHNNKFSTWKKGVNRFSYLTADERNNLIQHAAKPSSFVNANPILLPKSALTPQTLNIVNKMNWKDKGCVSSVKNQKSCKCSYAFTSIAAIESAFLINNRNLTLSEQEIIDCSTSFGNNGCITGTVKNTFEYIKAQSISSDTDYPYMDKESQCKSSTASTKYTIQEYKTCESNINALLKCIPITPIAAAIYIKDDFYDYESGIYDAESSCGAISQTNAAVLVTGYDLEDSVPFIIVKNSWGAQWGEEGFAKLAIGQRSTGPCFIAGSDQIAYPVVLMDGIV